MEIKTKLPYDSNDENFNIEYPKKGDVFVITSDSNDRNLTLKSQTEYFKTALSPANKFAVVKDEEYAFIGRECKPYIVCAYNLKFVEAEALLDNIKSNERKIEKMKKTARVYSDLSLNHVGNYNIFKTLLDEIVGFLK